MKDEEKSQLLQDWFESKETLSKIKERELALRCLVHKEIFDEIKEAGTHKIEFEDGSKLKLEIKYNYKVDEKSIEKQLLELHAKDEDIAKSLIRWKPELVLAKYKNLPKEYKDLVDVAISYSIGTPSLEIVPTKEEKDA